jgi:sterol desaturase/sphingolipid hydroxylase (fatty acid hydroxylase superfamily)
VQNLIDTLTSFAILFAIFTPLERLFPAQRQRVFRAEWGTDLLFFLGQYWLWTGPVVAALAIAQRYAYRLPIAGLQALVRGQPFWLQALEVVLLSDVSIYWVHRWSHSNRFLWSFHRVHHTAERIDWLAAHREHPFDNLLTRATENLPLILLGFPLHTLAGFAMFRGLWALYIHSNCALTPGPLRFLVGAPRLHHWHHAIESRGRVNFANLSPVMDLVFGTYHDPGRMPASYGLDEKSSHNYFVQLAAPLVPESLRGLRSRIESSRFGARLRARPERSSAAPRPTV